jgi:TnpA family transposase
MCTLWELRGAIRSGDIWIEHSRKFANPESYLIPKKQWPSLKIEFLKMANLPKNFADQLKKKKKELEDLIPVVDQMLAKNNRIGEVRIENDELIVPRYLAEDKEKNEDFKNLIGNSLPRVDLADILLEVDSWVNFSKHFTHLSGNEPRSSEIITSIYASIISLACNIGNAQMAQASSIPRTSLLWVTKWYLRENTLSLALAEIINFHHRHPLSPYWGGGTLSSSDGQRFPASVKTTNATKNPKYYGFGTGLTNYSWTSDQYSQYGSKIIPSTMRDATYILDAILDNITELEIIEHTSDTHGYTDIIFALFDLLGLKFCPRLKDLGSQKLYRFGKVPEKYKHVAPLLKGIIHEDYILKNSDEMLRVAGSVKLGWVSSSLLVSKIQSSRGLNISANPLKEYGQIEKTIHILKYISDEGYQRKIGKQLNKGEALHTLRQFLFFLNESKIRIADPEDQQLQADCLNLMTNAVILWNTVYMWKAIEQLKNDGYAFTDNDIAELSPCRFEHINRLGKFLFHSRKRLQLRPLRAFK